MLRPPQTPFFEQGGYFLYEKIKIIVEHRIKAQTLGLDETNKLKKATYALKIILRGLKAIKLTFKTITKVITRIYYGVSNKNFLSDRLEKLDWCPFWVH